ncbi:MAG: hypothetical protein HYX69_03135 [Planctomycetia bacterium]|nr:hypothetical protein [Planctomycetia bacterium]
MNAPSPLRRLLLLLLAGALFLPIMVLVVLAVGRILLALEDPTGAAVLDRIALGLGIVWACAIVAIPLVLCVQSLVASGRREDETE